MNIETANTFEKFLALEPYWNDLLKKSASDNPFSTFEWCRAWLEIFGRDVEILVIVVKVDEAIKAIAPFCMRKKGMISFIGYPQNDYAGLIVARDNSELIDQLAKYLSGLKGSWDRIVLDQFAEGQSSDRAPLKGSWSTQPPI